MAKYKSFITQEMLKKGFLASTHFYACTEHSDEHFRKYFEALEQQIVLLSDIAVRYRLQNIYISY